MINSYILNKTNFVFDTVIHVHELAGAERVKEWLVHSISGQLQCKLAALNFLLETSSLFIYLLTQSLTCLPTYLLN